MIKLGETYTDRVTGFSGVAVGRTEYMYGCVRVSLQAPGLNKDGKPLEWEHFDEQRLDPESAAKTGGPGDVPPQREAGGGRSR